MILIGDCHLYALIRISYDMSMQVKEEKYIYAKIYIPWIITIVQKSSVHFIANSLISNDVIANFVNGSRWNAEL